MSINCEKGYILTDLLLTLTCILMMTSILVPFIIRIAAIQHDHQLNIQADEILDQEIVKQLNKDKILSVEYPIKYNQLNYYFKFQLVDNKYFACMYWNNSKQEEKRKCRYVPIK